jgi:phosphatidylglycerophosphate synthase
MPRWVNSDHLTVLAVVAMFLAGLAYWLAATTPIALVAVVGCLAVNWFGDSLDGTLARVRRQQRPRYGFYVDHVVDCVGTVFLFGGLGLSGYMTPAIALGLLVAYLLLAAESYLATYCVHEFRMTHFMMGPTELRIILSIGTLALLVHPYATLFGTKFLLFDVGGVVAIAGMGITLLTAIARNTVALYRAEPRPEGAAR